MNIVKKLYKLLGLNKKVDTTVLEENNNINTTSNSKIISCKIKTINFKNE